MWTLYQKNGYGGQLGKASGDDMCLAGMDRNASDKQCAVGQHASAETCEGGGVGIRLADGHDATFQAVPLQKGGMERRKSAGAPAFMRRV